MHLKLESYVFRESLRWQVLQCYIEVLESRGRVLNDGQAEEMELPKFDFDVIGQLSYEKQERLKHQFGLFRKYQIENVRQSFPGDPFLAIHASTIKGELLGRTDGEVGSLDTITLQCSSCAPNLQTKVDAALRPRPSCEGTRCSDCCKHELEAAKH